MYKKIPYDKLAAVQTAVLSVIKNEVPLSGNYFKWLTCKDQILDLPEIQELLCFTQLTDHVYNIAVSAVTNFECYIHLDQGYDNFVYSFNIPLLNTNNTYLTTYTEVNKPVLTTDDHNLTYWLYTDDDVTNPVQHETNTIGLVDTRYPHKFESFTGLPRIMLLIRLKPTFTGII